MIKLNFYSKLIRLGFIFFYLISSKFAICQNLNDEYFYNLENELNQKNLTALEKYFKDYEKINFKNKFIKLVKEFPNAKWKILQTKNINLNQYQLDMRLSGSKDLNEKKFKLESNYQFIFTLENGEIQNSYIKNNLTIIRNDNNQIDINISIPNKVLTGSKYDIDIILNTPLGETIIAGGIKEQLEDNLFDQSIRIKPLATGGIFKVTRAPIKAGNQIWTGIIAHPQGIVSFTKSVEIVESFNP